MTAAANFAAVPELNTIPEDQTHANRAIAQLGNIATFSGTPIFALVAGNQREIPSQSVWQAWFLRV